MSEVEAVKTNQQTAQEISAKMQAKSSFFPDQKEKMEIRSFLERVEKESGMQIKDQLKNLKGNERIHSAMIYKNPVNESYFLRIVWDPPVQSRPIDELRMEKPSDIKFDMNIARVTAPASTTYVDPAPAKKEVVQSVNENPMHLDSKHDAEVIKNLTTGIETFAKKPIGECTTIEKLEALVKVMRDQQFFGFNYIPNPDGDPKTVEQTYIAKGGDCDELSRMFVTLAGKLGITDIKQFYIKFREQATNEDKGHAALFYVEDRVLYIDPAFNRTTVYKKFSSPEEVLKDPEFRKMQEDARLQESGGKGIWKISEIGVIHSSTGSESLYYYEKGIRATKKELWIDAIHCYNLAIEKGFESAGAYGGLGFAYHRADKQEVAIPLLNKAIEMKKDDPKLYSILGYAYLHLDNLDKYDNAADAFGKQLSLNPKDNEARYNFGNAYNELGNTAMNFKEYRKALNLYTKTETILIEVPANSDFYKKTVNILENIKSEKKDAENKLQGNN